MCENKSLLNFIFKIITPIDDKILTIILYFNLFFDPVIGPSIVLGGRSKINKKFHTGKKFTYETLLPNT